MFSNVKYRDIPYTVGGIHDFELYQWFVAKASLRRLSIRTIESRAALPADLSDSRESDGIISQTLFSHLVGGTLPPAQFESLEFEYTNLQRADKTFTKYIDLSQPRSLQLHDCAGTDVFLNAMTSYFEKHGCCKLESFGYTLEATDHINHKVVEKFLSTCEGLKSLMLVGIDNFADFDLKLLQKYGATLQTLAIHPDASGESNSQAMGLTHQLYATIAEHCRKLRQLALPLFDIRIDISPLPDASRDFDSAMRTLLELPELKSLRVFNWPKPCTAFLPNEADDKALLLMNQRSYMSDLDSFAYTQLTKLVNQVQKSAVPIIGFGGVSEDNVAVGDVEVKLPGPVCYVSLKQYDVFG